MEHDHKLCSVCETTERMLDSWSTRLIVTHLEALYHDDYEAKGGLTRSPQDGKHHG